MKEIYVNAYGDCADNRGIYKIAINEGKLIVSQFYQLDGKSNMIINYKDYIITSIACDDGNYLRMINKETMEIMMNVKTEYFYCYGFVMNNKLYAASFSDGVDSMFDLENFELIKNVIHQSDLYKSVGRSHYINYIGENILSVDNCYQQLYKYDQNLNIIDIKQFEEENIRLLSDNTRNNKLYLNTEITNDIIVLNKEDLSEVQRISLAPKGEGVGAVNALSANGKYLCASIRMPSKLCLMRVDQDGLLSIIDEAVCKDVPRDGVFADDYLLVSATNENCVQLYRIINDKLVLKDELSLSKPVTFAAIL